MVADNNPETANLFQRYVERHGFQVFVACGLPFEEVISTVRFYKPSLLLVGHTEPEIEPLDFVYRIRRMTNVGSYMIWRTPIVMYRLTDPDESYQHQAIKIGANEVLFRPFPIKVLNISLAPYLDLHG